jgi:hypothetical protein
VGLYFPHTSMFTSYTYRPYDANRPEPWATSYIAPVTTLSLQGLASRSSFVYRYTAYVMYGSLAEIRAVFTSFRGSAPAAGPA